MNIKTLEIKTSAKKNGRGVRCYQPKLLIKIENTKFAWLFVCVSPVTPVYTGQSDEDPPNQEAD